MIRYFLFLSFFLFSASTAEILDSEQYILWNQAERLTWNDFESAAPNITQHAALSHTGISIDVRERNGLMSVRVEARFDRSKSWKTKEALTNYLLMHEQLHFDITELYARRMRKKLKEHQWDASKEWSMDLEEIFDSNQRELWEFQDHYDRTTKHSLVKGAQLEWESNVADSLKFYEPFSDPDVFIEIR